MAGRRTRRGRAANPGHGGGQSRTAGGCRAARSTIAPQTRGLCAVIASRLRRNRGPITVQTQGHQGVAARCLRPTLRFGRKQPSPEQPPDPALADSRCLYEINYFFLLESDRYLRPSTILSMMRASAEAPMKATIVTVINEIILIIFFLSLIYSSLLSLKAPPDAVAIV